MSKRIVLTFATGKPHYLAMAEGLGLSIAMHHSKTERVLVTDHTPGGARIDRLLPLAFDKVIAPPKHTLNRMPLKVMMSPFRNV